MYNDPKLTIENTGKKDYEPPTLIEYGKISDMTKAGGTGNGDGFISNAQT